MEEPFHCSVIPNMANVDKGAQDFMFGMDTNENQKPWKKNILGSRLKMLAWVNIFLWYSSDDGEYVYEKKRSKLLFFSKIDVNQEQKKKKNILKR